MGFCFGWKQRKSTILVLRKQSKFSILVSRKQSKFFILVSSKRVFFGTFWAVKDWTFLKKQGKAWFNIH